jgi:hypothetical protein
MSSKFILFGEPTWQAGEARKVDEFVIWKYELTPHDVSEVEMPRAARILKFDCQGGDSKRPCLWALMNKRCMETRIRRFRVVGTGDTLQGSADEVWHYIGTAQASGGLRIWHCFEILFPVPEGYKGTVSVPPDFPTIPIGR